MTRPIKFRAWDGKRMTTSGIMFSSSNGELFTPPEARMKVMQFTGLTDRNGVEVYEGDLLSIDPFLQVVYLDGGFCFYNPAFTGADRLSQDRVGRLSVIGNIYQNPELLKGGQPV